ncbi:MAG TPA: ABC transporter substrate-binding protein [Thermodesulfobacteriota bacterium]|nr:ABC transporter substrate-binding protein [Thermodesulfobacteriota bacterium]
MDRFNKAIFVLAMAFSFAVLSSATAFGQEIRIGVIGPMKFVQGKSHWTGAVMAAEEINAKGGVQVGDKKMKITLIQADSNEFLSITDATNAMERLITKDKVHFVVGGFRTEAVMAMQDIAMDHKKIFIGCGAAHNELCERVAKNYNTYKYWFRMTPFNSTFLVKAAFIHLGTVAAVMKQSLNIPTVKVAIVAEKAMWADPLIPAAEGAIPKMDMEVAGVWRPSPVATDVTAELSAIQRSGAHIIFMFFSSSVGIPFARQAGELKIPAVQVGINVEAQKDGFWQATQGKGNYVITSGTYARGVEFNELTKPFVENYIKRFGETPTYTAGTYEAVLCALAQTIAQAGTLDPEKLVPVLEERVYKTPPSVIKYMKDAEGRPLHDITFGPGYATGLAIQWQDGKLVGVWPNKWKATPEAPEVTYKGVVPIKLPPWMVEKHKK